MKKTILLLSVLVFTMLVMADENSATKYWSQYKPGTYVTYKMITNAGGQNIDSEMTLTLKAITPEEATLEMKMTTNAMDNKVEIPPQEIKISANSGSVMPGMPTDIFNAPGTVKESITINGKTYAAAKVSVQNAGANVTVWMSDEVPGGMVKVDSEASGAKVVMEVIDYNAVK